MKLGVPQLHLSTRLLVAGCGMLPVAALVPAIAGWIPLAGFTCLATVPAWIALVALASRSPSWRRALCAVLLAGMAATLIYDAVRLPLTALGGLRDGIPNIGRMLVGDLSDTSAFTWTLGYFYRYLGDGGGLALAYFMGRRFGVRSGLAFGAAVCVCLWATLAVFPVARTLLFPLTPYAMGMTMAGHLVFGGVLGALFARLFRAEAGEGGTVLTLVVRETAELPPVRDWAGSVVAPGQG